MATARTNKRCLLLLLPLTSLAIILSSAATRALSSKSTCFIPLERIRTRSSGRSAASILTMKASTSTSTTQSNEDDVCKDAATTAANASKPGRTYNCANTKNLPFLYGGDFAGLSATFCATTGKVVPVPDYLVPNVMMEWGQQPVVLEVISSEDLETNETESSSASLTRHTVTVVPEVGCGVDNLDTMKSKQVIDLCQLQLWDMDGANADDKNSNDNDGDVSSTVLAVDYPLLPSTTTTTTTRRAETIFGLDTHNGNHRMRVMVDMVLQHKGDGDDQYNTVISIKTPIFLVLERQTSTTSSGGKIADDGGLDARTVSNLMGDALSRGKPFAERDPVKWHVVEENDKTMLRLPGNITVSHQHTEASSSFILQVGHVVVPDKGSSSSRHVVTRHFGKDGTLERIEYAKET